MTTERPAAARWAGYWEGVEHRQIFAVEARDHVERLRRAVPLAADTRVLDFGCGFGHVAQLLAPLVAEVGVWDAAQRMRSATAARAVDLPTVVPIDLSGEVPVAAFDLVLANSVVQYMERDELAIWLGRWRSMLAPSGRIVLSDIPVPDGSASGELLGMLRFARRNGFLGRALRDGAAEALRYARSRGEVHLLRLTPGDLTELAASGGLDARVLAANLTHRAGRLTVELTPAESRIDR